MTTYSQYQAGSFGDAVQSAEQYLKKYPNSPESDYVLYLQGNSYYSQIPDISRDQDAATRALADFQELVKKYPESDYVEDSKYKIQVTEDQLAGKEMSIGRFYLTRHNYTAAINRFRNVLQYFQTTRHARGGALSPGRGLYGPGHHRRSPDRRRCVGPQLSRQPMV